MEQHTVSYIIFTIITWIPIISLIGAVILACIGWYKKLHNKPTKRIFISALICIGIVGAYFLMFCIIGFIGFGPGPYQID